MRRREFLGALGGIAAWPLVATAQRKLPTIGFLGTATPSTWGLWTAAFVQRLREHGWIEDRTVTIEFRWAEGSSERFADIAAEFVRLKVDVIFTSGGAVSAVKRATATIPIVFTLSTDPVGSGLVESLARPGGNATGLSSLAPDTSSKRLELLREVVPELRRLAIIFNAANPNIRLELREVQAAARTFGMEAIAIEIQKADDIPPAFEALKVDALYAVTDPLVVTNRVRINTLALAARLPTMHGFFEGAEAGGLMSYGPNFSAMFRRGGDYVDKILRGVSPADLPVEQPVKFDLVVNQTTAKGLGLKVSETFLARADQVIE